ncbi:MAG: GHKL domain-containing protein [Ruminococcus sp.]|nr:GHKL domain-containing protein [Ruminococcus sp.]
MFRKVQLRFFTIITAILLAIFIAVLGAVNIIMNALMEHQTKVVLEQVASGVEYNSDTKSFTFKNPDMRKNEPPKDEIPQSNVSDTTELTEKTVAPTETEVVNTEKSSENILTETEKNEVLTDEPEPEESRDNTLEEIYPIETDAPTEENTEPETKIPETDLSKNSEPTYPLEIFPPDNEPWENPDNWGNNEYPTEPAPDSWHDDWHNNRNDHNYDAGRAHPNREIWGNGGFMPTADKDKKPVLDGYTITDGNKPPEPPANKHDEPVPKSINSIDFFIIMADDKGEYIASLNNDDMTSETAQTYITQILHNKNKSGMADNYSFFTEQKSNGTLMVLTDKSAEINIMNKLKRTTFIVGIISIVILSVAAYFLSGLIVKPLKETFEKQKRFISDASHELKTPLTVISANADVLSGELGYNKWLNYIQDQTDRMNVLVNDLLSLTRLENKTTDFIQTEFNLSQAIINTALPFECQAFESKKNFVLNIDENISVIGSEQHIKQMAGIFIDNALKYSKENGTVRVSLTKEDGKPVFSVYNTGMGVKESEKYKIFERFYRSDESRNRATGGYGLGLAIAKSIIDKHKFKIDVENEEGKSICFVVTMN